MYPAELSVAFEDRTVIVTGAGRGLGRAYAVSLAGRGARVVVNDLDLHNNDAAGAQDTVDAIRADGGTAVAHAGSVADPATGHELVRLARHHFGPVDAVINNAGNGGAAGVEATDLDDLRKFYDVHVTGSFNVAKASWDDLARHGAGRVVNTISGVGLLGMPDTVAYSAAKGGVLGLTRALAADGRRLGISVNAVAPIAVTAMAKDRFAHINADLDARHVAAVVLWLASRACPLNGEFLSAGGQRVARWTVGVNEGAWLPATTPESVARAWPAIRDDQTILDLRDAMAEVEFLHRS